MSEYVDSPAPLRRPNRRPTAPTGTPPIIAVSGPDYGGGAAWLFTSRALRRAGGRPVRVTPGDCSRLTEMHGLVLGGGADVGNDSPVLAGEWRLPVAVEPRDRSVAARLRRAAGYVLSPLVFVTRRALGARRHELSDGKRDRMENRLLTRAVGEELPVLGICRGAQLINVFFGGTLHRDLSTFYAESPNPWTVFPRKSVRVVSGSRLQAILRVDSCPVNSLHRNAIAELGRGLAVCAQERNGVVQAVERSEQPFLVGVQWHPEYLPQRPEQRRLFEQLVVRARRRRLHAGNGE